MKYLLEIMIANIFRTVSNMFSKFQLDKINIGEDELDYYNNFYLKGIKHEIFTDK